MESTDGETYGQVIENRFKSVASDPLSTFGVDVDTASYTNIRRMLNYGQVPPPEAVRVEEMINYFSYDYPAPTGADSFSITTERGACPWNQDHELVLVGLRGKEMEIDKTPPRNLVFLVDVSGSMSRPQKLPLVKASLVRLVKGLTERDTVAVVTYAGDTGVALEPTSCRNKRPILDCIEGLGAGGSTNGAGGIRAAYDLARKSFYRENINRVILVTDGDFNVGISDPAQLQALIEKERESGVFLTVVGVGSGNLDDETMSTLAKHGNGQYIYLDSVAEARRAFEDKLIGTLVTIAKDVKLQIEFNPAVVEEYRLIGYERRVMRPEDFRDDAKDSGEIGAGHAVTALYEIVPTRSGAAAQNASAGVKGKGGILEVRLRYKAPWAVKAKESSHVLLEDAASTDNLVFASSIASFGMVLSGSKFKGSADFDMAMRLGESLEDSGQAELRAEFLQLIATAKNLAELRGRE